MAELFGDVYRGINVMVTGAYGFKGSWLSYWLKRLGANVLEYGHPPRTIPSHYSVLTKHDGPYLCTDTLDYPYLERIISEFKPAVVFHLAAKSLVIDGFKDPRSTFKNNVMGAVNLMEACRLEPAVKAIVMITTDKVYSDIGWEWGYRENDTLGGFDPYSASKVGIEHAVKCYRRNFFPMIAVARAGNVIGGGDWSDNRLIPDIIKATVAGKTAEINTPLATRPWQHVLEPLSGYLMLGEKLLIGDPRFAKAWNFGPSGELTVEQVVEIAQQTWNKIDYVINPKMRHNGMVNLLKIDSTRARKELGWQCLWDQRLAIEKTIEWYRDYYTKGVINTKDDLDHYEFLMKVGYLK